MTDSSEDIKMHPYRSSLLRDWEFLNVLFCYDTSWVPACDKINTYCSWQVYKQARTEPRHGATCPSSALAMTLAHHQFWLFWPESKLRLKPSTAKYYSLATRGAGQWNFNTQMCFFNQSFPFQTLLFWKAPGPTIGLNKRLFLYSRTVRLMNGIFARLARQPHNVRC